MRRREFITLFGGAAVWPILAHAQQTERVRRIGVLMNTAAGDQEGKAGVAAFRQILRQSGWDIGRDVQIDVRWGENNEDLDRKYAAELIALKPRCHPGEWHPKCSGAAAYHSRRANCIRTRVRPGRRRLCR